MVIPHFPQKAKPKTLKKTKITISLTHDEFVRFIFSILRFTIAFFRAYLPPETVEELDLEKIRPDDDLFTDDKTLRRYVSDVAFIVPLKDGDGVSQISIQLEHKSYSTNDYIVQLETYASLRHRQEYQLYKESKSSKRRNALSDKKIKTKYPLSRIISVLLYNGKSANPGVDELEKLYAPLPGAEKLSLNFKPIIVNLRTINIDEIPDDPECPELRIGLLALKLIFNRKPLENLATLLAKVQSQAQKFGTTQQATEFGLNLVRYFSEQVPSEEAPSLDILYKSFNEKVGEHPMKGGALAWYNYIIDQGKKEGMIVGEARGEARGVALGETRGKADGEILGKINSILLILKRKFTKTPKCVVNRLNRIQDGAVLDSLLISALDSATMDEFKSCLPD